MYTLLNRLKELGVHAVYINSVVFIVTHDGELLEAQNILDELRT